jgi:hypothetical protein
MVITLNAQAALTGLLQMYSKDARQYTTSWMATLYNFHVLAKGSIGVDILGAGYSVRLGRLTLTRTTAGDLTGRLILGAQDYATVWHRLAALRRSASRAVPSFAATPIHPQSQFEVVSLQLAYIATGLRGARRYRP